jgi:hypothetical protein
MIGVLPVRGSWILNCDAGLDGDEKKFCGVETRVETRVNNRLLPLRQGPLITQYSCGGLSSLLQGGAFSSKGVSQICFLAIRLMHRQMWDATEARCLHEILTLEDSIAPKHVFRIARFDSYYFQRCVYVIGSMPCSSTTYRKAYYLKGCRPWRIGNYSITGESRDRTFTLDCAPLLLRPGARRLHIQ